jgi:thiamine biosynthesis protein ThiS
MEVTINGEQRHVEPGITILGLLRDLEITPDRVAVELDRAIVKKNLWDTTELRDGAKLEIVHFVGGG